MILPPTKKKKKPSGHNERQSEHVATSSDVKVQSTELHLTPPLRKHHAMRNRREHAPKARSNSRSQADLHTTIKSRIT